MRPLRRSTLRISKHGRLCCRSTHPLRPAGPVKWRLRTSNLPVSRNARPRS
nr:MAG TPA: hypothetical protein [Caudoviricetes sp.]